jgi:preprotein translocase subunit SecA
MPLKEKMINLQRWIKRQNGCTTEYDLEPYKCTLRKILECKDTYKSKGGGEIKAISLGLSARSKAGQSPDEMLVEAYACVYEAVRRVLHVEPFDVQLLGAIVLHQGKIAEMQTGEGKTLTAVFPACLNALQGKGVHILTFNDYLACRDAQWMGPVYEFLGLRVGHVREGMRIAERQAAYACDVTYLSAKESGFDYLRDSLCMDACSIVHRDFNYAIVDEADSILIDEARIPLVIAGKCDTGLQEPNEKAMKGGAKLSVPEFMAQFVTTLKPDVDFEFDAYARNIFLTEAGQKRAEELLGCGNMYDPDNFETLSSLHFALHAGYLLHRDKDYIVRNTGVELVDECTGRVALRRQWPQGLQAAIEAKEGCVKDAKGRVLNSMTLQHFVLLYPKRAGMTATAQPAEEEFRSFYGLSIVAIPPAKKRIRKDCPDIIFKTKQAKYEAVVREIITMHATLRPLLVGTQSVAESSLLALEIRNKGIECSVLNAKEDAYEAEIIANAGRPGAVTISTNMAGRGTDIRLGGEDAKEKNLVAGLGGLYVIGTNRHESRRIDDQLRGRAGRQGDPGSSRFFISLEDDLFLKYHLNDLIPARFFHTNGSLSFDHPIVTKEIDRVQRIIEGQHCEIKKTLCRYSVLVEQQRAIMHRRRKQMLGTNEAARFFSENKPDCYAKLFKVLGKQELGAFCSTLYLSHFDNHWSGYCEEINDLKDGIHLRRWGKQDPLFEFQKIIIDMFKTLLDRMEKDALAEFSGLAGPGDALAARTAHTKAPGTTWTYLVNDDPLEDKFALAFANDIGFSAWAGLLWPLTALYFLLRKEKTRRTEKKVER